MGHVWTRRIFTFAALLGAAMRSACDAVHMNAGHSVLRSSGSGHKPVLDDAVQKIISTLERAKGGGVLTPRVLGFRNYTAKLNTAAPDASPSAQRVRKGVRKAPCHSVPRRYRRSAPLRLVARRGSIAKTAAPQRDGKGCTDCSQKGESRRTNQQRRCHFPERRAVQVQHLD
jgi:hypothetical protein